MNRPFSPHRSRFAKAFTLIELLVVVAIIAILAALLLPVFNRVREGGRRSTCASNMKQLAMGVLQYAQDFDEKFPPARNTGTSISWRWMIQPYLKSTQVNSCPSRPAGSWTTGGNGLNFEIAYAGNWTAGGGSTGYSWATGLGAFSGDDEGIPLAQFVQPAQTIQIMEVTTSHQSTISVTQDGVCDEWGQSGDCLWAGHLGTANYAFADGHVKAMRPTQTLNPATGVNMWWRSGQMMDDNTPWSGADSLAHALANLAAVEARYR